MNDGTGDAVTVMGPVTLVRADSVLMSARDAVQHKTAASNQRQREAALSVASALERINGRAAALAAMRRRL